MALNRTKNIPLSPASKLITRIDETSTAGTTYIGKALPASLTTEEVWQIQKITDTEITYAKGTPLFDKQWSLRTTYEYK